MPTARDRRGGASVEDGRTLDEPALRARRRRRRGRRSCGRTGGRCGGRNGPRACGAQPASGSNELSSAASTSGCAGVARGSGSSAPSSSYAASCAMRRAWRSSRENGVAMKRSMNDGRLVERVLAGADRDHVRVVVLARELGGRDAPRPERHGCRAPCSPRSARRCPIRRRRRRASRCRRPGRARRPARRGCRTPGSHRAGRSRADRGRRRRDPAAARWCCSCVENSRPAWSVAMWMRMRQS